MCIRDRVGGGGGTVGAGAATRGHVRHRRVVALGEAHRAEPVSYTHLRAHETVLDLVCRLLLEKKQNQCINITTSLQKPLIQHTAT